MIQKLYISLLVLIFAIHSFWYQIFSRPLGIGFVKTGILPLFVFIVVLATVFCCSKFVYKYCRYRFLCNLAIVIVVCICSHLTGWFTVKLLTIFAFGIERIFLPHNTMIWHAGFHTLSTFAGVLYSILLLKMLNH